jgi:DNA-directed RNA polymerase sigma subunit (sigma70/sigma32)
LGFAPRAKPGTQGDAGDIARRRLTEANLVGGEVSKRYIGRGMNCSDLIQEGNWPVARRGKVRPSQGLQVQLLRYMVDSPANIRASPTGAHHPHPRAHDRSINRLSRAARELQQDFGHEPSPKRSRCISIYLSDGDRRAVEDSQF